MTEVGTLKELNVQPGDVVELVENGKDGWILPQVGHQYAIPPSGSYFGIKPDLHHTIKGKFRIISRAAGTAKTWREMTDAEKGALLLAHHEGSVIESYTDKMWMSCAPKWRDDYAYRVRPEPEAKRETVTLYADMRSQDSVFDYLKVGTIDLINGEPDFASFQMDRTK